MWNPTVWARVQCAHNLPLLRGDEVLVLLFGLIFCPHLGIFPPTPLEVQLAILNLSKRWQYYSK